MSEPIKIDEEQQACCAHIDIKYKRIFNANKTCSDSWVCKDCNAQFIPSVVTKQLRRENEALRTKLAACEKALKPLSLDVTAYSTKDDDDVLFGVEGGGYKIKVTLGDIRRANQALALLEGKKCTCGELHINDRTQHNYDGKPCYVKDSK